MSARMSCSRRCTTCPCSSARPARCTNTPRPPAQAAPLPGLALPEAFLTLRRLLEARLGKAGRREWVQVLRLLEVFRPEEVEAGVSEALRLGAIGFDAVKHLVLCRVERRPPRLDLEVYPYLPRARVATTSARAYLELLGEGQP